MFQIDTAYSPIWNAAVLKFSLEHAMPSATLETLKKLYAVLGITLARAPSTDQGYFFAIGRDIYLEITNERLQAVYKIRLAAQKRDWCSTK